MGKFCSQCGQPLEENVAFCSNCGCKVNSSTNEQNTVNSDTKAQQTNGQPYAEPFAGQDTQQYSYDSGLPTSYQELLQNLSRKLSVNGMLWVILALTQYVFSFFGFVTGSDVTASLIGVGLIIIVALINTYTATRKFNHSKMILSQPSRIIEKYKTYSIIWVLLYNLVSAIIMTMVFPVIGIICFIVGFILDLYGLHIHNYVMNNYNEFSAIQDYYGRA